MANFRFHQISNTKKIRHISKIFKNSSFIVFLHGFMSDLEGKKPNAFLKFAKRNKISFLALEYSGHGKSSGKFTHGNISKWSKETSILIKNIVKKNKIILVGSSMGAWISLIQFQVFQKQIEGFLGIGSAPEFLEKLMWNNFTKKEKREIKDNGIINLKHGDHEYPITYQLIRDGKKNKVLHRKIYKKIKVTMIHGSKDKSVPVSFSKKVLKIFKKAEKKLVIAKNGDHSLSSAKWLKLLNKELKLIVN